MGEKTHIRNSNTYRDIFFVEKDQLWDALPSPRSIGEKKLQIRNLNIVNKLFPSFELVDELYLCVI